MDRKLWKAPNTSLNVMDNSFGQLIERNYFPFKLGLKISDKGDAIKKRWRNEKFDQLCNELKNINEAKITDILFYLFDESSKARESIVNSIAETKRKTLYDGKDHDFTVPPDDSYSERVGISYISSNSNDIYGLRNKLLAFCKLRKYKSKGSVWIGFGSLEDSNNMIDVVVFNEQPWKYNKKLDEASKILLGKGQIVITDKIGRNEKCFCGSGLKYKKCCGSVLKKSSKFLF
ncbi:MAG: SEC-C metal-binding domain-containing protein [bacterium]